MKHSFIYACDNCGHEIEAPFDNYDPGKCSQCHEGKYHQCGESYDQEYVDEIKYREQQDREYEARHRYDDRY